MDKPWEKEAQTVTFTDAATGLPCYMGRNHGGAWCGYVGITPEHPWHGKSYDDIVPARRTPQRGRSVWTPLAR